MPVLAVLSRKVPYLTSGGSPGELLQLGPRKRETLDVDSFQLGSFNITLSLALGPASFFFDLALLCLVPWLLRVALKGTGTCERLASPFRLPALPSCRASTLTARGFHFLFRPCLASPYLTLPCFRAPLVSLPSSLVGTHFPLSPPCATLLQLLHLFQPAPATSGRLPRRTASRGACDSFASWRPSSPPPLSTAATDTRARRPTARMAPRAMSTLPCVSSSPAAAP